MLGRSPERSPPCPGICVHVRPAVWHRGAGSRADAVPRPLVARGRGRAAEIRRLTVMRDQVDQLAVEPEDVAKSRAAEPHRALGDRVEDRLDIGRRARSPQDLARRRLLLERFGEVAVARLQLLEQPDVLDGDDRLVGEGLEQRDLLVREGPGLLPTLMITPPRSPSRSMGTASVCASLRRARSAAVLAIGDRRDMHHRLRSGWHARQRSRVGRVEERSDVPDFGCRCGAPRRCAQLTHRTGCTPPMPALAQAHGAPRRSHRTPAGGRWELLITRRISLVAVCCSSASVSSRLRACSS